MMTLTHWVCLLFFLRELLMLLPPVLVWWFGGLFVWVGAQLDGDRPMSPQFRKVHRLICCQLPTDFHNISIVYSVWAPGVCSSWTIYGTQWCCGATKHLWNAVLQTTQFAYRKGLGTCDALLCVSHTLQNALESWQEAKIVQIDFSAAFDRVNHLGILHKLCFVGIGGSVLSILIQFLSNRPQHIMVDGRRIQRVNVVSAVSQGSVLDPSVFLLYTSERFFPFWLTSWSVMLMTPLWWLLCYPQASELQ